MDSSPKKDLLRFLAEDIGKGDVSSKLLPRKKIRAKIIAQAEGIVAGVKHAKEIFTLKGCSVKVIKKDGTRIKKGQTVLEIRGLASSVLCCERTALNLLSRMSGIATKTNSLVKNIMTVNSKAKIYATRKTAPGLRLFDKEAVFIGGGEKHRMSLDQMVMLKDNHIAVAGSLSRLISKARKKYKNIEVEVDALEDALLAASAGANIILLDNFLPSQINKTISTLKKAKLRSSVQLEASGGINSKNIKSFAKTGVERISVGEITHSASALDFTLEVI